MPVKFFPKMSSSGGTSVLGVVVSVMDRASGLIPGSFASSASFDCILYILRHRLCSSDRRGGSALETNRQALKILCRAMAAQLVSFKFEDP